MRIAIDLQGFQSESRFRGIGRYSSGLVRALLRTPVDNEFVLVLNGAFRETIEPIRGFFEQDVPQDRIKVFEIPLPVAENNPENVWKARASEILRDWYLEEVDPDWLLVTSLFEGWGDDACVAVGKRESRYRTAVVLHDLIPLARPGQSFEGPPHRSWYENKLESLKRADLLLANSHSTRQEGISLLDLAPERIVTIGTGVSERFCPAVLSAKEQARLRETYSLEERFILYVPGGFDLRKNFDGLFQAFSLLPKNMKSSYQLVIPGKLPLGMQVRLLGRAKELGIRDRVLFPGYVSDDDLIGLYRETSLFVFPSLHEGFGLPLVEAMACGAPVIGSRTTSIPEVIGFERALFDPEDPLSIAKTMQMFLTDQRLRDAAIEHGRAQALTFSWDSAAAKTMEALEKRSSGKKPSDLLVMSDFGLFRRRPMRIAVMKLDHRGDFLLAVPALRKLRAKYPDAQIDLFVGPWNIEIAETLRLGDRVFAIEFFQNQSSLAPSFRKNEFQSLLQNLGKYDMAIDFRRQRDTRLLLLEFDAKLRVGYRTHDESVDSRLNIDLDAELDRPGTAIIHNGRSASLQMLDIVEALGSDVSDYISLPELSERSEKGAGVAVFPFAGNPIKEWGLGNFENVILALVDNPSVDAVHIYSSEKEATNISDAVRKCRKVICHPGLNFQDLCASLRSNVVALANNSFGAHVSAFVGLKVVGVYGGHEKAEEWAPVFGEGHCILHVGLPCSPCHLPNPQECVHGMECLTRISPGLVVERILALVNRDQQGNTEPGKSLFGSMSSSHRSFDAFLCIASAKAPPDRDIKALARSLALNHPRRRSRELFVDISELVRVDAKSGIQRVVRSILSEWLESPPKDFVVQPVYLSDKGGDWHYRYARQFSLKEEWPVRDRSKPDFPVDPLSGDVLFAPDLSPFLVSQATRSGLYDEWRSRDIAIFFLVHDLLPVLHPEWFSEGSSDLFHEWLECVGRVSTGLVCNSRSTESDLRSWLAANPPTRYRDLVLSTVHLGGNFLRGPEEKAASGPSSREEEIPDSGTTFLMVGTLEPRKCHEQVLLGFDRLWKAGADVNLVFVGKLGWKVDRLAKNIHAHPEFNRRFFWLTGIDDNELERIYRKSHALVMASLGEGFGLPIVEAVQMNVPIIARDLPVFREILGEQAVFFSGETAEAISEAISRWMALRDEGRIPSLDSIQVPSWRECAEGILSAILPPNRLEKCISQNARRENRIS